MPRIISKNLKNKININRNNLANAVDFHSIRSILTLHFDLIVEISHKVRHTMAFASSFLFGIPLKQQKYKVNPNKIRFFKYFFNATLYTMSLN